jgi:hypothetical protein
MHMIKLFLTHCGPSGAWGSPLREIHMAIKVSSIRWQMPLEVPLKGYSNMMSIGSRQSVWHLWSMVTPVAVHNVPNTKIVMLKKLFQTI